MKRKPKWRVVYGNICHYIQTLLFRVKKEDFYGDTRSKEEVD